MADNREIVVSFRLNGIEAAHLDAAGKALHQPRGRGDFARAAALYAARQKVPPPSQTIRRQARRQPSLDTRTLARILAAVGQIGGTINQLARLTTVTGTLPSTSALADIAADVSAIRDRLTAVIRGDKPKEIAP